MNFRNSYLLAAVITSLFAIAALIDGFSVYAMLVLVLLVVPLFLPLSVRVGDRLAFAVSLLFTGISTMFLGSFWIMFSKADSLSDFEGPNGEGSPIAPVIGVCLFAMIFMIPWTIASLRGYKHIKEQARQVEASDGD